MPILRQHPTLTHNNPVTMEEEEGEDLTLTVATEAKDEEMAESSLKDIREDSKSNKIPAAKAHFNDFLEILCKESWARQS